MFTPPQGNGEMPGATAHWPDQRGQCLQCKQYAEGNHYPFYVEARQGVSYRVVHEEKAFICHSCAEARLCFIAWLALGYWFPLGLLTSFGMLTLAIGISVAGDKGDGAYQSTSVGFFLLSAGLFIISVKVLRGGLTLLRYAGHKHYRQRVFPDTKVSRLAIELRRTALLSSLQLAESEVRFLTEADRLPDA
jgi:hypothetical protein